MARDQWVKGKVQFEISTPLLMMGTFYISSLYFCFGARMWDRTSVKLEAYTGTYLKRQSLSNGLNAGMRDASRAKVKQVPTATLFLRLTQVVLPVKALFRAQLRLEVLGNCTVQMRSCTNGKLMLFEDSFCLLQFQQVCGAMADLAVTGLLGYSCLFLIGILQAQLSKRG